MNFCRYQSNIRGRYNITIQVDGRNTVHLKDVHHALVNHKIVEALSEMLLKYVNHRKRIMTRHGALCTPRKLKAVEKCQNRLSFSASWSPIAFKKFLLLMEDDLLTILPGHTSKYFHNDSQFIYDMLTWAKPTQTSMAS